MAPVLEAILRRGDRRMAENVYRVLAEASEAAGVNPDQMADMVERDDRYLEISAAAVQAAMSTLNEQKVTALAHALGSGLRDEAKLDSSWLIIHALADMEGIHVRALAQFARYPTDSELEAEFRGDHQAVNDDPRRRERMGFRRSLPAPVVSTLLRHGLVGQDAGIRLYVTGVTDFGRDVLRYLEQARPQVREESTPPA